LWKCHPLFGIIIDWDDQDRKSRQLFVVSPVAVGMTTEQQRNIVKFATTKQAQNNNNNNNVMKNK
jgi:hypothetical protein